MAVSSLMLATRKKMTFGWFVALTYAIYVFYDLEALLSAGVSQNALIILFFIASVSILAGLWTLYGRVTF